MVSLVVVESLFAKPGAHCALMVTLTLAVARTANVRNLSLLVNE